VPTDRDTLLDRGVTALSDFAGRGTFTDKEIEKERGVVLESGAWGKAPASASRASSCRSCFTARATPIGCDRPTGDHRARLCRPLRAYYHEWYTPDRMTVVAVGDIDPAKMEGLIRDHFGGLQRPAAPRVTPVFGIPRTRRR